MTKALADWDDDHFRHPELVWWSRLDGRWQVEVQRRPEEYTATLAIFDHNDGNKLVHEEQVGLAYNAQFGPDVADVADWQVKAIEFADSRPTELR